MANNALISVVITTFNRKNFLPRAIKTVAEQTYSHIEIIVVDDHSRDDPRDVIESIDYPVRYFRQEINSGVAAARNKGLELASGKYVAFLDDDDLWVPDKLEKQLEFMDGRFDACLCAVQFQNSDKTIKQNVVEITHEMLKWGNHFCSPSGLLIKKQFLEDINFDENIRYGEDWEFYYRLSQKYTIGYCPLILMLYNRGGHDGKLNSYKNIQVKDLDERLAGIKKHREDLGEWHYRYRVASKTLAYIASKKNKSDFFLYSLKHAGFTATFLLLFRKILRRERMIFK